MKRLLSLLLSFSLLLTIPISAQSDTSEQEAASILQTIGVFKGSDKGLELDRSPTRLEGLVMLIRLLGEEDEALSQDLSPSVFNDVPSWGVPYTNYAYNQGLTKGIGDNQFGSKLNLSSKAYSTFVLRALGYDDSKGDFTYQEANTILEQHLGLDINDSAFTRGDLAKISYTSMYVNKKDTKQMLISSLILSHDINISYYSLFNNPITKDYTNTNKLISSNQGQETLTLAIENQQLTVSATHKDSSDYIWVQIDSLEDINQFSNSSYNKTFNLSSLPKNNLSFSVYLNDERYGEYLSWVYNYTILYKNGLYCFEQNPIIERNQVYYESNQEMLSDYYVKDSQIHSDNDAIREKAEALTSHLSSDYEKARVLHNWVADNLYYDYDNMNNIKIQSVVASEVLDTKTTVCEGYSNLYVSMLRSLNIPSRKVSGYALTPGSSFYNSTSELITAPNHTWAEVYIDNRWVICDPTWDSLNTYKNGTLTKASNQGLYFDISLEVLSRTHAILMYRETENY